MITGYSLGWEGKPENLKIEETGDSEDKSGSKTGTFDELLRFQDISASWMTLSFAGFEETPAAGLSFPKIKVSIKTGKVIYFLKNKIFRKFRVRFLITLKRSKRKLLCQTRVLVPKLMLVNAPWKQANRRIC